MGTQFTIFDGGESPKKGSNILPDGSNLRRELAAAVYVSSDTLLGGKGRFWDFMPPGAPIFGQIQAPLNSLRSDIYCKI